MGSCGRVSRKIARVLSYNSLSNIRLLRMMFGIQFMQPARSKSWQLILMIFEEVWSSLNIRGATGFERCNNSAKTRSELSILFWSHTIKLTYWLHAIRRLNNSLCGIPSVFRVSAPELAEKGEGASCRYVCFHLNFVNKIQSQCDQDRSTMICERLIWFCTRSWTS